MLVSIQKKEEYMKRNSLMAQTTHLALFGLILVTATPPIMYFIDYNYIYTINISWFQKNEERKKKKSLMAQTMPDVLFGPSFITTAPPVAYFVHYNYI